MLSKIRIYKGVNVIIYFSKNKKELRHYTGVKVDPNFFDAANGVVKEKGDYKTIANELNKRISTEKSKVDNLILDAPSGIDIIQYLKDKIASDEVVAKKEGEILTKSLLDYYKDFLDFKEKEVQRNKIKPQSIKDYISLFNALKDFTVYKQQWRKSYKLLLTNINEDFLYELRDFLREKRESSEEIRYLTKGGLNDTTICKRIDSLKAFFNWLVEKKICYKNQDLEKFSITRGETDIIVISKEEETEMIKYLEVCEKEEYKRLLRIAIVLCNTGMRYSDAITFRKQSHLKEVQVQDTNKTNSTRKVISKFAVKTITSKNRKGIYFEVPLNSVAEKYLSELDYRLDYYKNIQTFNEQIKLALKEISIFNSDYQLANGDTHKKYELISSHVFRKTFITNCILKNIPIHILMGFTSHRKFDTLNVYIQRFGHNSNFNYVDSI